MCVGGGGGDKFNNGMLAAIFFLNIYINIALQVLANHSA